MSHGGLWHGGPGVVGCGPSRGVWVGYGGRGRLGKAWYGSARRSWLGLFRSVTASYGVAVEEWSVMLSFRVEWQGGLGPVGSGTISRGESSHGGSGLFRLVKSPFGWTCLV